MVGGVRRMVVVNSLPCMTEICYVHTPPMWWDYGNEGMAMSLTLERLKALMEYNQETGVFTWRKRPTNGHSHLVGKVAGNKGMQGYYYIQVDGERFKRSRLAWFYMTGQFPSHEVDHINGNVWDDSWENLRAATRSENAYNQQRTRSRASSGYRGVVWNYQVGAWKAYIQLDGRHKHIGHFKTPEEAATARDEAIICFGLEEFTTLNNLTMKEVT